MHCAVAVRGQRRGRRLRLRRHAQILGLKLERLTQSATPAPAGAHVPSRPSRRYSAREIWWSR